MENFLSIYQYCNQQSEGSSKDIFMMAIQAYEDQYGEVSDQTADKWYAVTAREKVMTG